MSSGERLESWKEIATYLNRDVRTVQRWEALEGLPVHRHQHRKRGSVYALRAELDTWRASRADFFAEPKLPEVPASKEPERSAATVALALLGLGLAGAAAYWLRPDPVPPPTPVAVALDAPRVLAEATREGGSLERIPLDADGAEIRLAPDDRTLYVYSCGGHARVHAVDLLRKAVAWTTEVGDSATCGTMSMSPAGERLFVADRSDLVVIDTATRHLQRFTTPATKIRDLAVAPDGRTVYAAAVFHGLLAIDAETGTVRTVSSLPCPMELELNRAGDLLYVNYQCSGPGGRRGHDAIDVLDTTSQTSVGTIHDIPNVGGDMVLTPGGEQLWADGHDACVNDGYDHQGCPHVPTGVVNVIRTLDRALLRTISIGGPDDYGLRLSVTPDGSRIVARSIVGKQGRVTVVSATTLITVETLDVVAWSDFRFRKDGTAAYAILGEPKAVTILPIRRQPMPPPGLSARWPFDGTFRDSAGGNDFTGVSDDHFAPGRVGRAARPSADAEFRLDAPTNLEIDRGEFTAAAWVNAGAGDRTGTSSGATVIELGSGAPEGLFGWRLGIDSSRRPVFCQGWFTGGRCEGPRTTTIAGQPLDARAWHHLAITQLGDALTLYVDGRVSTRGVSRSFPTGSGVRWLRLGSEESSKVPVSGPIDEVEIYNRALAPEEIFERGK